MEKRYLNLKGSFFSNIQLHSDAALLFWFNVRQKTCILLQGPVYDHSKWWENLQNDAKMNFWYGKGRLIWKKDLTTIDWPMGWSRMIDDDLIDRKWDLIKNSCKISFVQVVKMSGFNLENDPFPKYRRSENWEFRFYGLFLRNRN